MTKPEAVKSDKEAFEKRHQQMRMNAGDWLLKNRHALKLCQAVLTEKQWQAWEELDPKKDSSLACYLQEIDDAVDLLGQVIGDLRGTEFWPQPETV